MRDRAIVAKRHNNALGAAYMACITGMWTHILHAPDISPFADENAVLNSWYITGFDASRNAIEANEIFKKAFDKFDKARAERLKEEKAAQKRNK